MKKDRSTPLVDEYLKSIDDCKEAETDHFFYTRLKARMEKGVVKGSFSLRPVLIIAMLAIMLIINSFVIIKQNRLKENATLEDFGNNYSITLSNY